MIYLQLAMVLKVESTVGKRVGCGLQYLPTSVKAVTSLKESLDFLTRKDGFTYSTLTPTVSGLASTPSYSSLSK